MSTPARNTDTTKSTLEVLLVLVLLGWAMTFTLPYHFTTEVVRKPSPQTTQVIVPREKLIISGIPVNSSSDVLIDYFADGVWREEQETIFESIDRTFTPYTINAEPVTTSSF